MAEKRYRTEYIYGSEAPARRYDEPERVPRKRRTLTEEELRRKKRQEGIEVQKEKAGRIGVLFTMFVAAAIAAMFIASVRYISLINTKNANAGKVSALESELQVLKEDNAQTKLSIDTSIDYDYIYRVATEELGMIYAGEDQIIKYQSGESEYVMQFFDIPEN